MPEYLAPGVYVEETSFRAKSIEGVGTSTTAFVGPTRRGPVGDTPELVTSLSDFERLYGSLENLEFADAVGNNPSLNFVGHAVRAYFDNVGSLLYVMRVTGGAASSSATILAGAATASVTAAGRFPGAALNGTLTFQVTSRPVSSSRFLDSAPDDALLRVTSQQRALATDPWPAPTASIYRKDLADGTWPRVSGTGTDPLPVSATMFDATPLLRQIAELLTISVQFTDADGYSQAWEGLAFSRNDPNWIGTILAATPATRADQLANLVGLTIGSAVTSADLLGAIQALDAVPNDPNGSVFITLTGGSDGSMPSLGDEATVGTYKQALKVLAGMEDISIVAAPGSSAYSEAQGVQDALITHAEGRRAYRIAVLDTPPGWVLGQVRDARGRIDSKYAALYYPWVVVTNPLARPSRPDIPAEITLPPSGFVCGIYARSDEERGVYKAPANEVVQSALRFETDVNFAQQEVLNPIGVNCLRFLTGRGYRVWGARLVSSDPEWKYVSDRRYFNYLEASIDRGTQWAVFEPNGDRLWANITQTISDFLYNEWRNGALLGTSTDEAFFVRCDRSTMTQNDLDNGRLICLIGVAIVKPAEFVILRVGQKTADARS
jgi:phage tail sheath protein FI